MAQSQASGAQIQEVMRGVLCIGLLLLQKNIVVPTELKCMGQSVTGYGIRMSPDMFVQARRVSE